MSTRQGRQDEDEEVKEGRRYRYEEGRKDRESGSSRRDREDGSSRRDRESSSRRDRGRRGEEEDSRDRRGSREEEEQRDSERRGESRDRSRSPTPKKAKKDKKKTKKKKSKKDKETSFSDTDSDFETLTTQLDQNSGLYSNVDNPFNDINLGSKFQWVKKDLKEKKRLSKEGRGKGGESRREELRKREEARREEAKLELEKLNQRRIEREAEWEFREQEQLRIQREADLAQLGDWEAREDEFHLEQAKRRAEIRIRDNRAKPIDLLAINLKLAYEGENPEEGEGELPLDLSLEEPYHVFDNLSLPEVDDLKQDIQLYLALEKTEANTHFWTDMMVVCEARLNELRAVAMNLPSRVPTEVLQQIDTMLSSKTPQELDDLQTRIVAKLKSGQPIDTDYWELNLKSITVWKAKARLRKHHEIVLSKRLEQVQSRQLEEAQQATDDLAVSLHAQPKVDEVEKPSEENLALTAQDFAARLFRQEREDFVAKATSEDLEIDEEIFDSEVNLDFQPFTSHDQCEPRKPMYFNRVHTGYEWNKYNQTHYDADNPPPKVVQGYKFHIFYPGLFKDPTTGKVPTPSYKIEPDPMSEETQLLRFSAGPPYQDIAFRIVRREWEYSHKKGFKSAFINHTLYLYFHFKRHYYRR